MRWGLVIIAALLGCGSPAPAPEPQPEGKPRESEAVQAEPRGPATIDEVRAFLGLPTLDHARAFAINLQTPLDELDRAHLLGEDGQLNPDRTPEAGARLSDAQLIELVRIATYRDIVGPAYCFYPHHAVALYDAEGAILGELTICFLCGRIVSTLGDKLGPDADFEALDAMLRDLHVPLTPPMDAPG